MKSWSRENSNAWEMTPALFYLCRNVYCWLWWWPPGPAPTILCLLLQGSRRSPRWRPPGLRLWGIFLSTGTSSSRQRYCPADLGLFVPILCFFVCCLLHTCPRCFCSGRSRTSCWDGEGDVLSWETSWVVPPGRDWLCPWSSQSKSFIFNLPYLFEIADEPDFEHDVSKVIFFEILTAPRWMITLSSYKGSALLPPHGWTGRGQTSKTIWRDSQVKSLLLSFSHFLWYLEKHHENKIGPQRQQQRASILDRFNHHLDPNSHWSPRWCVQPLEIYLQHWTCKTIQPVLCPGWACKVGLSC